MFVSFLTEDLALYFSYYRHSSYRNPGWPRLYSPASSAVVLGLYRLCHLSSSAFQLCLEGRVLTEEFSLGLLFRPDWPRITWRFWSPMSTCLCDLFTVGPSQSAGSLEMIQVISLLATRTSWPANEYSAVWRTSPLAGRTVHHLEDLRHVRLWLLEVMLVKVFSFWAEKSHTVSCLIRRFNC